MDTIKTYNNGKVVVILKSLSNSRNATTPLFCDFCEMPMKSPVEDAVSYRKHGTCSKCDQAWTNYPGINWNDDTKHPCVLVQDEWKEYIKERRLLSRPIINFK